MGDRPVAAVFGGSRGLGLLIGRELAARGWRVVLLARDPAELERAAASLDDPSRGSTVVCDVRDADAVHRAVTDIEQRIGPLAAVFTVAGVIQVGPVESMNREHFEQAIDTMLWGPVNVALAVLPYLRARGRGRIGTVTSIGGMVSPPHLLPYATAKFGAVGFSDGLAAALQGTGVTATTVVPGLMRTGSHVAAEFTGDPPREYAWFALGATMPLVSMDADRAARRIVSGVLRGRPMVALTPLTWLGIRVRGLAPATTTRVMGVVDRLLPDAPERPAPTVTGGTARRALGSRLLDALTTLGDRAARRTNEPVADAGVGVVMVPRSTGETNT